MCADYAEPNPMRYRVETMKPLADVIQDLEFAIGSNNFRITSRNRIGDVIAEREEIDFPDATVVHFCNLELARKLLAISSDYLLHMPCRVVIWSSTGLTFVEVKLVPEDLYPEARPIIDKINKVLTTVVDTAAEVWSGEAGNTDNNSNTNVITK